MTFKNEPIGIIEYALSPLTLEEHIQKLAELVGWPGEPSQLPCALVVGKWLEPFVARLRSGERVVVDSAKESMIAAYLCPKWFQNMVVVYDPNCENTCEWALVPLVMSMAEAKDAGLHTTGC